MRIDVIRCGYVDALIRATQRKRAVHAIFVVLVVRAEKDQGVAQTKLRVHDRALVLRDEVAFKTQRLAQPFDGCGRIAVPENGN